MQAEQQTVTQTKKTSSGVKKDKKVPSKTKEVTDNEQNNEIQQTVVQQTASVENTSVPSVEETLVTNADEISFPTFTDTTVVDIDSILEYMNKSDSFAEQYKKYFKGSALPKDERIKIESSFKKFTKSYNAMQTAYFEYFSRQVAVLEKNSHGKSSHPKKSLEKGKAAIQKKLLVEPFLLSFMKLDQNTLVSRADALSSINAYVKREKDLKNPEILIENDLKSFKIGGELIPLFVGIEKMMRSTNKLAPDETIPTQIKYTDIMKFMTHCFVKADVTGTTTSTV
jgi:hypothetical protein